MVINKQIENSYLRYNATKSFFLFEQSVNSETWWHRFIIPATQEVEAGGGEPAWATWNSGNKKVHFKIIEIRSARWISKDLIGSKVGRFLKS